MERVVTLNWFLMIGGPRKRCKVMARMVDRGQVLFARPSPHCGLLVAYSRKGGTVMVGGYGDNSGVGAAWVFANAFGGPIPHASTLGLALLAAMMPLVAVQAMRSASP
jgi:hypothetical protein